MNYLLIDTANQRRIVTIVSKGAILVNKIEANDTELSKVMVPLLAASFKEAKMEPKDIDTIFVVNGPGSFTGIRIGVTIAKVYAFTMHKKIIPLSELELMATTKVPTKYIVPCIDARRGYVYAGIYDQDLNPIQSDRYLKKEALEKLLNRDTTIVSDDLEGLKPDLDILKIIRKHEHDEGVNPHECNPNYLKETEAVEKLHQS